MANLQGPNPRSTTFDGFELLGAAAEGEQKNTPHGLQCFTFKTLET